VGVTKLTEEPIKFYRRFIAHFSYDSDTGEYVPTMVCKDMKDDTLKVFV